MPTRRDVESDVLAEIRAVANSQDMIIALNSPEIARCWHDPDGSLDCLRNSSSEGEKPLPKA